MEQVKEAPFRLTQKDPIISASEADGTAAIWSDIWSYQVPNGSALIVKPHHTTAFYLEDASAEVGSSTCQIKIEKRDASKSDVRLIYGQALYVESKEFQEAVKMAHFVVPPEGIVINEREYLVISVKDDGAIDASDSYFELRISRLSRSLAA